MTARTVLFALALAGPLSAQPTGSIRATVTDSVTGQAVRRARAWVGSQRAARGDSLGRFVLDSLTSGRYRLSISCAGSTRLSSPRLLDQDVEVGVGQEVTRAFSVDARDCDQRPLLGVSGEFRGFFEGGFEHSRFVPCSGPVAGLPPSLSAIREPATWAWVEFGPRAAPRAWPDGEAAGGFTRWYVHWRGTIRGPDRYGHMSVAEYEATVETFIAMRRPRGNDCT